jgi:hypothetical protein
MQEKHLFEYAVIRVVPRVEREEFINVGVVLFCKKHKFLQVLYTVNEERLRAFCSEVDPAEIRNYLLGFEKICRGDADGGPIALLDIASRFRWLTANRSTVLQTSKVHPGFCNEPQQKLEQLFRELVG